MAVATSIELDPDGMLRYVRRASGGPDVSRLRREATVLDRLDHPGAVTLVAVGPYGDDGIVVATAYVGGGTLADRPSRSAAELAALLAQVADTIAHAHTEGVVHGDLTAERILLAASGDPVVCGWGTFDAGQPSAPSPADDVAAIGRMLAAMPGPGVDGAARELAAIAGRASASDPAARPTASALADALRLVGADRSGRPRGRPIPARATPGGLTVPPRRVDPSPRRRRAATVAVAAVAVGIVTGGVVGAMGRLGADVDPVLRLPAPSRSIEQPEEAPLLPPPTPDGASGVVADDPTDWEPVDAGRCVPLTGDTAARPGPSGRCQRPEVDRGVVTLGPSRWRVGRTSDLVVFGSWDCGDTPTPAVLRPATGEVFVFPRWATAGEDVPARPVGVVADGADRAVALDADADGCHEIGVIRPDGTGAVLDPRSDGS